MSRARTLHSHASGGYLSLIASSPSARTTFKFPVNDITASAFKAGGSDLMKLNATCEKGKINRPWRLPRLLTTTAFSVAQ